ncbi:MAG: Fe-S cluster assembly ATPase SufC [Phycisphaera sp.]|nr:Fe-S cluster assembly ATPase SufC [Phycisphaera sp.]
MSLLEIKNLHASVDGEEILKGVDLVINPGEVHSIMGPNGSGKSTLANVIAGKEDYEITAGSITFKGQDLLEMEPHERATSGVFLAFQYPVEIPGVSGMQFLKAAVNAKREANGEPELDAPALLKLFREKAKLVEIDMEMLKRPVNEGFSGGEKKRAEIFQMAVLQPTLGVLDETDSGLDIDALKIVSHGVNAMRDAERGFLVITHYQRLLDYIVPDFVHVLVDGRIVKSGGKELALELEDKGYNTWVEATPAGA